MAFDILMNGVGNAFSRRHWGTNFLVRRGDFLLGIDCPDSYRRALQANEFETEDGSALGAEALDGMFITHLHGDHVNGLEMVLAYRRYVVEDTLDLYTTPHVAENLWDRRLAVSLGQSWDGEEHQTLVPDDYYRLSAIPWEETAEIGPLTVEMRPTVHHVPTAALRLSDGDVTVGYSCDTAFDEGLVEWLADCDLILHETSYGPGHTRLAELRELPERLTDKLLVVHLPDDVAEMADEVELEFAREGEVYPVGK